MALKQRIGDLLNEAWHELENLKAQPKPDPVAIEIAQKEVARWQIEYEDFPDEKEGKDDVTA